MCFSQLIPEITRWAAGLAVRLERGSFDFCPELTKQAAGIKSLDDGCSGFSYDIGTGKKH